MTNRTNTNRITFDADQAINDVIRYIPRPAIGLNATQYNNLLAECGKHHGESVTPEKYIDMISNLILSVLDGLF